MADESTSSPTGSPHAGPLRAPLRRKWVTYVAIFFVACVGIAIWGYIDATVVYPARGEKVIEFTEYAYLNEVGANRGSLRTAGIDDPAAEYARLRDTPPSDDVETTAFYWLEALSRLNRLDPEYTTYADLEAAQARYTELDQRWKSENRPKALAAYDIPSQWIILVVFAGLAGYNAFLFIRAALTRYTYDPDTRTLTLPNGATFTPDHIEEIDKRRWDKFKIAIALTNDHPAMPGQTVHFDTYRHDRLEDWILEMEEEAFGPEEDEADPELPDTDDPDAPAAADDGTGEDSAEPADRSTPY